MGARAAVRERALGIALLCLGGERDEGGKKGDGCWERGRSRGFGLRLL